MQITYWDAYDGQAIRIIEGSLSAEINALAISADGEAVVSGGADKEVKVWGYDEGHCFAVGKGHSGAVVKVRGIYLQRRRTKCVESGFVFRDWG